MFRKYNKAEKSLDITLEQLEKTTAEKHYLEETLTHVELADSVGTLQEIKHELEREGYMEPPNKRDKAGQRRHLFRSQRFRLGDGSLILVGRNNRQNDNLTFRTAAPTDLWFHAQNIPGSHVILKAEGNPTRRSDYRCSGSGSTSFKSERLT